MSQNIESSVGKKYDSYYIFTFEEILKILNNIKLSKNINLSWRLHK